MIVQRQMQKVLFTSAFEFSIYGDFYGKPCPYLGFVLG